MRVSHMAKTLVAGAFAVLGVVAPVVGSHDVLTTTDVAQMMFGVLSALGVYVVPNGPPSDPPPA